MWLALFCLVACATEHRGHDEHEHEHEHENENEHADHAEAHGEHADDGRPAPRGEHRPHSEHAEQAAQAEHGEHGEGHGHHGDAHHRFDNPEEWAKTFDDPLRDDWQQPDRVIDALDIQPGMTVADIGAGTGYFNPHLAAAVGPEGTVIAIDIEPKMVEYMTERAVRDGTPQVKPRVTTPDDPGLAAGEVDRVLIVDTYHHIAQRPAYFTRLAEAMKPGGKLVVVDLTKEAPFGPPASQRLTAAEVTAELAAAGWVAAGQVDLPHQYVLSFTPEG